MTNEQTVVMLGSVAKQLEGAIASAEEYLEGADVPRNMDERYIGNKPFQGVGIPRVESDYEKFETSPMCLNDTKEVLSDLKKMVEILTPIDVFGNIQESA